MGKSGSAGYEYCYCFHMDHASMTSSLSRGEHDTSVDLLFTFRTNFLLKITTPTMVDHDHDHDGNDNGDVTPIAIGTETRRLSTFIKHFLDAQARLRNTPAFLVKCTSERLKEYSVIPNDAIARLADEAFDFAARKATDDPRYSSFVEICIVVDVDVCTVQQEGEPLDAAMDRAIRPGRLRPTSDWHAHGGDEVMWCFLKDDLGRIRVEDVDQGSRLMDVCTICLGGPTVGTQISSLPSCGHAFHYHCAVGWLVRKNTCPLCCRRVHDLIVSNLVEDWTPTLAQTLIQTGV